VDSSPVLAQGQEEVGVSFFQEPSSGDQKAIATANATPSRSSAGASEPFPRQSPSPLYPDLSSPVEESGAQGRLGSSGELGDSLP
jgi:hypothetical protein